MKIRWSVWCFLVTALSCVVFPAHGHDGTELSGAGFAVVDGVLTPGEWSGAAMVPFSVNLPLADGGGTTAANLYVMNDSRNLFIGLQVFRAEIGSGVSVGVEFENDHDAVREPGDDVLVSTAGQLSPTMFFDDYRTTCPGAPPGTTGCAPEDTDVGFPPPGTSDGSTAVTNDGVATFVEIAHPLDSADDAHDFSLSGGDTVGFNVDVRIFALDPGCTLDCLADTGFPSMSLDPSMFGNIQIQSVSSGDCGRMCASTHKAIVAECLASGGSRRLCNAIGRDYLRACQRGCR